MSELARQIADVVIGVLDGRGGFDHWWGDIDEDIAEEILEEIADAVAAALHDNNASVNEREDRYTLTDLGKAYRAVMQQGAKLNGEVKAGEGTNGDE